MGTIILVLIIIGFFMSDREEKSEFIKEVIINVGGALVGFLLIALLLDKLDILSFERLIYFIKRIAFGNPF